jgi:hypothetical protein
MRRIDILQDLLEHKGVSALMDVKDRSDSYANRQVKVSPRRLHLNNIWKYACGLPEQIILSGEKDLGKVRGHREACSIESTDFPI